MAEKNSITEVKNEAIQIRSEVRDANTNRYLNHLGGRARKLVRESPTWSIKKAARREQKSIGDLIRKRKKQIKSNS